MSKKFLVAMALFSSLASATSRIERIAAGELKRVLRFGQSHGEAFDIQVNYYPFGHDLAGELRSIEFKTGDGYRCEADQLPNMKCRDDQNRQVYLKSPIDQNDYR